LTEKRATVCPLPAYGVAAEDPVLNPAKLQLLQKGR
jgi:hypothetical protein